MDFSLMRCALQHTATHCNALQHTATHCNTLQHIATHCNTLQHAATRCSTLQLAERRCTDPNGLEHTLQHTLFSCTLLCCNTLCFAATHFALLQHTLLCCNKTLCFHALRATALRPPLPPLPPPSVFVLCVTSAGALASHSSHVLFRTPPPPCPLSPCSLYICIYISTHTAFSLRACSFCECIEIQFVETMSHTLHIHMSHVTLSLYSNAVRGDDESHMTHTHDTYT